MFSCSDALILATRILTSRKASRIFTLKIDVAQTMNGRMVKLTNASRQLRLSRRMITPRSMNTSLNNMITMDVNISWRTSTSFVALVTNRPTGFLSKNDSERLCTCRRSFIRMSYMIL